MDSQLDTIRQVRAIIDRYHPSCELEVDGGINAKTAPLAVAAGANVLVAQYSGAKKFKDLEETVHTAMMIALAGGFLLIFGDLRPPLFWRFSLCSISPPLWKN